jgi:hypothetical protein
MRNKLPGLAALALGCAAWASCVSKAPVADANMACVEHLEIPPFPPIPQTARVQSTISAAIALADGGRVESVVYGAVAGEVRSTDLFTPTIERFVRASRFAANCGGKTVRLIFLFRLITPPEPDERVLAFEYPNRFVVSAPPRVIDTSTAR